MFISNGKKNIEAPEDRYKNLKSLAYVENDVFTYFQEGSGNAVNYFWQQVKERKLRFIRKNKLEGILKRKKIRNQIEYDFVIDVLVPYQQEGLISISESIELNNMIGDFANEQMRRP